MAKSDVAKVVNYTPEMTLAIVGAYTADPTKATVEALATKFGKTTRSIIAKLSREGVYQKAEYVTKAGAKPETKEAKVEKIAAILGVQSDKLGGLETATKLALDLVFAGLQSANTKPKEAQAEAQPVG
jgi:3-hydroxyacyl-CoA dehydrogenase